MTKRSRPGANQGNRRAALPVRAKIAAITVLLAALGCISVIALAILAGNGDRELNREQIIGKVLEGVSRDPRNTAEASTATASLMTEGQAADEVRRLLGLAGGSSNSVRMVWLVKMHGEFVGFRGIGQLDEPRRRGPGYGLWLVRPDGAIVSMAFQCDVAPC